MKGTTRSNRRGIGFRASLPASPLPPLLLLLLPLLLIALPIPVHRATAQETGAAEPGESLEEAKKIRHEGNEEGVASQGRIDEISDETDSLFSRYRAALSQIDSLRVYNAQMRRLVTSQEKEIASLEEQVDRVEIVGRSVTPLMLRMIDAIDALVQLDVPFLIDERKERIAGLHKLMGRADVTNAEKYRQIMEAYQVENEYGRTIEAYRSTLSLGGAEVKVDLLRFGRIALVYQTLDGKEAGVWDQASHGWKPLDASYRTAIRDGLRVARKQSAPDLMRIPLPAATRAGGEG